MWGAGLYSGGDVTVINSNISGNSVTNSDGQGGGIVNYGKLTVNGSQINWQTQAARTLACKPAAFGSSNYRS